MAKAKGKMSSAQARKVAADYLKAKDAGKQAYAKAGDILDRLAAAGQVGTEIELADGRTLTIVDQFALGKTTLFKPAAFSRYSAEIGAAT